MTSYIHLRLDLKVQPIAGYNMYALCTTYDFILKIGTLSIYFAHIKLNLAIVKFSYCLNLAIVRG